MQKTALGRFVPSFALGASVSMARVQGATDLAKASPEDLMKVTITSASRREQSVIDVAAAVYVINQDDIRRSGLTLVPELLRLAPGVNVARIDGNKWAIAIRGFNVRWSNKLLVLVDGRTAYNRLMSGVYWETVNLPVELIDRIEVIRRPGASIWGANAVDGVINIISGAGARVTPALSLSLGGQNMFGSGHLEFNGADTAATPSLSSRTTRAQLLWRF